MCFDHSSNTCCFDVILVMRRALCTMDECDFGRLDCMITRVSLLVYVLGIRNPPAHHHHHTSRREIMYAVVPAPLVATFGRDSKPYHQFPRFPSTILIASPRLQPANLNFEASNLPRPSRGATFLRLYAFVKSCSKLLIFLISPLCSRWPMLRPKRFFSWSETVP